MLLVADHKKLCWLHHTAATDASDFPMPRFVYEVVPLTPKGAGRAVAKRCGRSTPRAQQGSTGVFDYKNKS